MGASFALILIILLISPALLQCVSTAKSADSTSTPIKQVIIMMMENHSFDNFFGAYPELNGSANSIVSSIEAPSNLKSAKLFGSLTEVRNGSYSTPNPTEGYIAYHNDWDKGQMDAFANNSGAQSMTYFTSSQLALEWDWAEEYSIGDEYFASYLSSTLPNRLISLAGYTPVTENTNPPPYIPAGDSIFGELSQYGISSSYFIDNPLQNQYPLNFFSNFSTYSASNVKSWSDFDQEVAEGTLPSVSWVMPVGGGASGVSQHPPENVTQGELWMLGIINEVMKSSYWNSTALFVTYDEGGGYYDHVPPPQIDGIQLGFRVPFILISPYAKENYVSHTILNHASILSFIDYNWHLPALNKFVADSNLPLDCFDFNDSYNSGYLARPPVELNVSSAFPILPQVPFSALPYSRSGSSSDTLGQMGFPVLVPAGPQSLAPFSGIYDALYAVVVAVVIVVGFGFLWRMRRRV